MIVRYCGVAGSITTVNQTYGYAGAFVGSYNNLTTYIDHNWFAATLSAAMTDGASLFPRRTDYEDTQSFDYCSHNYILKGTVLVYSATGSATIAFPEDYEWTFTADELTSGALTYRLCSDAGDTVFRQTLGTELFPVCDFLSTDIVYLHSDGTYSNVKESGSGDVTTEIPSDVITNAGNTTTEEVTTIPGDSSGEKVTTVSGDSSNEEITSEEEILTTGSEEITTSDSETGGCGSVIATSAAILALILAVPAATLFRKED